jgi:hypothetical protein
MDDRIAASTDILGAMQRAIEALVCSFADKQKLKQGVRNLPPTNEVHTLIASQLSDVLPQLLSRVAHPILQRNLVYSLPASSPLTAYFQRHLALAFLLHPDVVNMSLEDPRLPELLREHLTMSLHFRIKKDTNYSYLAARLTLLDIAIGPGLLVVPYQSLISPPTSEADSSLNQAPLPSSSDIKRFNEHVESLAQHIKILGNSIIEAGAVTDLTILEAKDCIEKLCSRLEYAVRIGGKKHHDMFGIDNEEKQPKITIFRKIAHARERVPAKSLSEHDKHINDEDAANAQIKAETAE